MKLINKSEQFVLQYNAADYTIPEGEFEVTNDNLGYHILFVASKWGKDVVSISGSEIPQIKQKKEEIKVIEKRQVEDTDNKILEKAEEIYNPRLVEGKEEVVAFTGASIETLPRKQGRPKKNVEQIA